jgi:hypothetical protein
MKAQLELIPPPDFKNTPVTKRVLEEDQKTYARQREMEKMREQINALKTTKEV